RRATEPLGSDPDLTPLGSPDGVRFGSDPSSLTSFRTAIDQWTHRAMRVAFRARGAAVVRQIEVRAAVGLDLRRDLRGQRGPHRSGRALEVGVRLAVAEAPRDAAQAGVDGKHRLAGREEDHAVRAALAHL